MREILFRGKRVDNSKWVEGSLIKVDWRNKPTTYSIMPTRPTACNYIVDPKTVGQYTGVEDESGTMIFEGDILRDDDAEENGVVVFKESEFCVVFDNVITHGISDSCYIRGNIHDNPELMEG